MSTRFNILTIFVLVLSIFSIGIFVLKSTVMAEYYPYDPPYCVAGLCVVGEIAPPPACTKDNPCRPVFGGSCTEDCDCDDSCDPPCNPTTGCSCGTLSTTNLGYGSKLISCSNGCGGTTSSTCYCTANCIPVSCPTDLSNTDLGFGTSTVIRTCTNDCGRVATRICYCKDCTLPVPVGTTLTNTGKQSTDPVYQTTSCSRGSGCTAKSANLYCTRCTPSSCAPTFTTDSTLGYGSVILSCNNTLGSCGTESRTCYIDACTNCTMPDCPTPLTNTGSSNPNMILENFRTCAKGAPCGGPAAYASCYEPISAQPTTTLNIYPDGVNKYGFSSSTHTGIRVPDYNLNDPIRMVGTYTDVNGATDVEAVSVWFRNSSVSGEIESPLWIDTAVNPTQQPKSPSNDS